jgi:hypothetical protein
MSTASLGAILRETEACQKPDCLRDLEGWADANGPCAQRDLGLVQEFFNEAKTRFTANILARADIKPMQLGNGHNGTVALILKTFKWTPAFDITDAAHPYNAAWKPFAAWCEENDLVPELVQQRDAGGREQWYVLTVKATPPEVEALRA